MSKPEEEYRYPGLLTMGERQWLVGEKEVSDAYERQMKTRILRKYEGMFEDIPLIRQKFPIEPLDEFSSHGFLVSDDGKERKQKGPDPSKSYSNTKIALRRALEENEAPVVQLSDVVRHSEFSRATVHKRLKEMVDNGDCESADNNGSTKYWLDGTAESSSSNNGGRKKEVSPQEIIEEIEAVGIPLTARMLANRLGTSKRTIYNRIEEIQGSGQDSGGVELVEIGGYGNATAFASPKFGIKVDEDGELKG